MAIITYEDKVSTNEKPDIDRKYKVTADDLNQIKSAINNLFPVGFIIEVDNAEFDPNTSWGGTWERDRGHVIVSVDEDDSDFSTSGLTGGEKQHTLKRAELPAESLKIIDPTYGWEVGTAGYNTGSGNNYPGITGLRNEPSNNQLLKTNNMGSGQPHNNMPPYRTAYRWIKTSM